jgi:hypothetical protein
MGLMFLHHTVPRENGLPRRFAPRNDVVVEVVNASIFVFFLTGGGKERTLR